MTFDSLVKQLANRINQPHVIRHYLLVVWRTALKEAEKKQLHIPVVSNRIWTKDEIINQLYQFESIDEAKRWFDEYGC